MEVNGIPILDGQIDCKAYAQKFIHIPDKLGHDVPLKLNNIQEILWDELDSLFWMIILKARQMGCSTVVLAYFLTKCITRANINSVVVSHEERATGRLLKKVKYMENSIPDEYKPALGGSSGHELGWPEVGSTFYIGTAGARAFGRGDTIHYAHLSELAFYSEEHADNISSGVGEAANMGKVVYESTANGRGGKFHGIYESSKEEEGRIKSFFFPWWYDPEYALAEGHPLVPSKYRYAFEPDEDEARLMSVHGLSIDQIRWRRFKIGEFRQRKEEEKFPQEYPENDAACFLVAGLSALPTQALLRLAAIAEKPFFDDEEGIKRWRQMTPSHTYVMPIDAAKGLVTSDPSVIHILNITTGQHEATARGKWPPDLLALKARQLGKLYGNPVAIPEREGYGDQVIRDLEKAGYPVYIHIDEKAGWPTVARGQFNRRVVIQALASSLRSGWLKSSDDAFINEGLDFQFIDGKEQAPSGKHDDAVMCMAIGVSAIQTGNFDKHEYTPAESYVPEEVLW